LASFFGPFQNISLINNASKGRTEELNFPSANQFLAFLSKAALDLQVARANAIILAN
jgi:hypothetical protein